MTAIFDRPGGPGHAAPQRGLVPLPLLWFGLFGAPVAWAAELISNYALMAHFCYPQDTPNASPGFGAVRFLAIVVAAVLFVIALAALFVAIRSWTATRHETRSKERPAHHEAAEIGEGRTRFMAMAGIIVSGIFVFGVLMGAVPLITMPVCVY